MKLFTTKHKINKISPKFYNPTRCFTSSNKSRPKFIFLEGMAAVGKSTICQSLHKDFNFHVYFENFVDLCNNNKLYPADGSILQVKWLNDMLTEMENIEKDPSVLKDKRKDIVFFDRSPLTLKAFARKDINYDFSLNITQEIKNCYDCSFVWIDPGTQIVEKRMLKRHKNINQLSESETRKILGELDQSFFKNVYNNYLLINSLGYFDLCFNAENDDPKINSKNLLDLLKISN